MTIVLNDKSVNKRQRKKNDAIKNGQWKDTGNRTKTNIEYIRGRKTKQKHNTTCAGHHYAQTNTNNVNKTCALLQTTGGKD